MLPRRAGIVMVDGKLNTDFSCILLTLPPNALTLWETKNVQKFVLLSPLESSHIIFCWNSWKADSIKVAASRLNSQQTNSFVLIPNISLTFNMYALKSILLVAIAVTAAIAAPVAPIGKSATNARPSVCYSFEVNRRP
jgi:hypothetical protein